MPRTYEEHMAEKELDTTLISELKEWGAEDAHETFSEEQLQYWYNDVLTNDPPGPKQSWLKLKLAFYYEDRWPNEAEFVVYKMAYKHALQRALYMLNKLWDQYVDDVQAEGADDNELYDNLMGACLDAMER